MIPDSAKQLVTTQPWCGPTRTEWAVASLNTKRASGSLSFILVIMVPVEIISEVKCMLKEMLAQSVHKDLLVQMNILDFALLLVRIFRFLDKKY